MRSCWCGNSDLQAFSADYRRCESCGTLVFSGPMSDEQLLVRDDETDFYGKQYWLSRQTDALGHADVHVRAREDLSQRNLHWLRTLLKYRLPPASVLELGCSHGSFVALMRRAGYDASGVEMSPWVVGFGIDTFGVPISVGPIDRLSIEPASLDVIVLMDVLEHLPDPLATMSQCLRLLRPDGLLLIQTPQFREEMRFEQLVETKSRFLEMLIPLEHVYLFSERSVTRLLGSLGVGHLRFEPAIFCHYDMFFVASREAVRPLDESTALASLLSSPDARFVRALLDIRQRELDLTARLTQADESSTARAGQIETLHALLAESETDRADRGRQIDTLSANLRHSEEDRLARAGQIASLTAMVNDERAARTALEAAHASLQESMVELESRYRRTTDALRAFLSRTLVRVTGRLGARPELAALEASVDAGAGTLRTIVVDLTPVLPGGDNGGAKIFVLELLRRLAALLPAVRFVLLTQAASHEELAHLDAANVTRLLVLGADRERSLRRRLEGLARRVIRHLPGRLRVSFMAIGLRLDTMFKRRAANSLLTDLHADLLFCPFTAPTFHEAGIPTICTIYDLQYKTYPEFFAPEDVMHRDRTFQDARRHASALVAISDYSRESAIRHGDIAPDDIRTIHLRMANRFIEPGCADEALLGRLGLQPGRFLIYPANFWMHKNHEMLLTAFGIAVERGLATDVKLVCTGAPGDRQRFLIAAAHAMGLGERVVFPGFLPNDQLAGLLRGARAMVFPSLYEGFGLPVIEAMGMGVPVACSNLTSLPEVASHAAVLFDPRVPNEIAAAIDMVVRDEPTREKLIVAGRARAAEFSDSDRMAREYRDVFEQVSSGGQSRSSLVGVYPDGWCGARLSLRLGPSSAARSLELNLRAPDWLPAGKLVLREQLNGQATRAREEIRRGADQRISLPLPAQAVTLVLDLGPTFVPLRHGMGDDERELSLMLLRCELLEEGGPGTVIYPEGESVGTQAGVVSQ